ncbi:hypothetical protein HBH82_032660 [Parastagonospora nodorum]|nr:hypothetical protein HBH82_032660 [Parastagonospora nodorum]KAH4703158.1 hypothetical protein HBH67_123030 [Parastagonospora nodorum]KAH4706236.1 hypothetical protein HBH78_054360 [Parastagonospora nodorum]KAH4788530.1 hypothetical protein HBH62_054820 [Parastagonospora nodorum]KAH4835206.1 hypothetical protein HBH63_017720 [Parastagonospora nodorum]
MPPQKTVMMGRKPNPRAGGRANMSRNVRGSITPGDMPAKPSPLRLTIHPPRASDHSQQSTAPTLGFGIDPYDQEQADEQPEEDEELPIAQPVAVRRSRSGREIKATKKHDFAYGSDTFMPSSVGKEDDEDGGDDYQGAPGPSPMLLSKRGPGRPRKDDSVQPSNGPSKRKSNGPSARKSNNKPIEQIPQAPIVPQDNWPIDTQSREPRSPPKVDKQLEECVDQIMSEIGLGLKIAVELPKMNPDGVEVAYTATLLMRIYIRAHTKSNWDVCDLVADTWIRAFHAKRRRQEQFNQFGALCWRYNEALCNRRKAGLKDYDQNAPNFSRVLKENDPLLDKDVTDFNPGLLAQLYTEAVGPCAARNLWADTMALCGSKLENRMQIDKRRGVQWNPKLIYDVMCTTLRMTRRKLTLKIEEATEGAWCKRYHMHALHSTPCYRKIAYDRKVAGEDSSDEDESGNNAPMTLVMGTDFTMPSAGDLGVMNGSDAVMGDAMDDDAEGESDDEYTGA